MEKPVTENGNMETGAVLLRYRLARTVIKGCQPGELLKVSRWMSHARPVGKYGAGPTDESVQEWERTPVDLPTIGDTVLLFLHRSDEGMLTQTRSAWDVPVWFDRPSQQQITLARGLFALELDLRLRGEQFDRSAPMMLYGAIRNVSETDQTFDPQDIVAMGIETPTQRLSGATLRARNRKRLLQPLVLPAGQSRDFEWDLRHLVPAPMAVPGRYWVSLRIPGNCNQSGSLVHFELQIVGPLAFEDAVAASPVVLLATAESIIPQPDGTSHVLLSDRQYLKNASDLIPLQMAWPPYPEFPLPQPGDLFVLCIGRQGYILYVAPATQAVVTKAQAILQVDDSDE